MIPGKMVLVLVGRDVEIPAMPFNSTVDANIVRHFWWTSNKLKSCFYTDLISWQQLDEYCWKRVRISSMSTRYGCVMTGFAALPSSRSKRSGTKDFKCVVVVVVGPPLCPSHGLESNLRPPHTITITNRWMSEWGGVALHQSLCHWSTRIVEELLVLDFF